MQVFTYENLLQYDPLIKGYVDDAIGVSEAKSLKTISITGNTVKFYKIDEPVGDSEPAYTLTLPDTSGLMAKLTGATENNIVVAGTDGEVKDSGVAIDSLATDEELKAVSDKADDNATAIEKLNGDATTDGSVAKAVKDSADAIDAKIGTLADLDTTAKTDLVNAINEVRAAVDAGGTGSQVTIDTATTTDGYLKSYTIKQGENTIGVIDIPKDLVVTAGEVVVDPEGQTAGTYVKLTIANQETPIYINVADLVDAYTAQASATQVQLVISDTNEISATIVAGSITATELAENAVTTAKIADANVTLAKLATDVTDTLTQVGTNKTNIEALQTLVGEGYEAIPEASIAALFS